MSAFPGYLAFPRCAHAHPGLGQRPGAAAQRAGSSNNPRWHDAWGIPVAEVASPCASSALPLNYPITFFALFGISAPVCKKQLSVERLSL